MPSSGKKSPTAPITPSSTPKNRSSGKKKKPPSRENSSKIPQKEKILQEILIIDSGGYEVKHTTIPLQESSSSTSEEQFNYKKTPNCIARLHHQLTELVGDEINTIKNKSQLDITYPLERGYCTDLGSQLRIWERIIASEGIKNPSSSAILLLNQPFTPTMIGDRENEVVFDDLKLDRLGKGLGCSFAANKYVSTNKESYGCCLVVDSGFSLTHIVPTYNGIAMEDSIKRINIGGKLLTNVLKQWISYRQWNMMDDFHVVNEAKEKCCFVPTDYKHELKNVNLDIQYVLPDFTHTFSGFIRNNDTAINLERNLHEQDQYNQVLSLSTERVAIPEFLFYPKDIGLNQLGLADAIAQSINSCEKQYQSLLWANILLIGGNVLFPNIKERLELELRNLAPSFCSEVHVFIPEDPIGYSIIAAAEFISSNKSCIQKFTRKEQWGCAKGFSNNMEKEFNFFKDLNNSR